MRCAILKRAGQERGQALIEATFTLPLILLVCVSIFEFGRAYQCWQVLTNAAREGARIAVLPGVTDEAVTSRIQAYLTAGQLTEPASASVAIDRNNEISIGTGTTSASTITVSYPFEFMVLQPVARLVVSGSTVGAPITMTASTTMRNE